MSLSAEILTIKTFFIASLLEDLLHRCLIYLQICLSVVGRYEVNEPIVTTNHQATLLVASFCSFYSSESCRCLEIAP